MCGAIKTLTALAAAVSLCSTVVKCFWFTSPASVDEAPKTLAFQQTLLLATVVFLSQDNYTCVCLVAAKSSMPV